MKAAKILFLVAVLWFIPALLFVSAGLIIEFMLSFAISALYFIASEVVEIKEALKQEDV